MTPLSKPVVDAQFNQMNGLQRAAECSRYILLCVEHWISPEGTARIWLRRNVLVGVTILIPALFIMPAIGLMLWQLAFWCSLLTGIAGKLLLIVLLIVGLKMIKR